MVRELIFMPFRIAGKVAEGTLGLLRGGDASGAMPGPPDQAPPEPPFAPTRAAEPGPARAESSKPGAQPPRSTSGREPENSDWDEDAPVPPGGSDPDDNLIADKVNSEVLGRSDVPKGEINLNVENGVVFLRGSLDDPAQAEELVDAAGQVDGVVRVENLIRA
jgi:hypothetical protein